MTVAPPRIRHRPATPLAPKQRLRRAVLLGQLRRLGDAILAENRAMRPGERLRFGKLKTELQALPKSKRV
jgi:hypothetical protein